MFVHFTIRADSLEAVINQTGKPFHVSLNINDTSGRTLFLSTHPVSVSTGSIPETTRRFAFGRKSLRPIVTKGKVRLNLRMAGLNTLPGVFASLGHIYDFTGEDQPDFRVPRVVSERESRDKIALSDNYPNPFNPETDISFQLPSSGTVTLLIYNVLGQKVRTLSRGQADAGRHRMSWNGRDDNGTLVSTGLYFYVLTGKLDNGHEFRHSRKMLFIR